MQVEVSWKLAHILKGVNKFLPNTSHIFWPICVKFSAMQLRNCEFCKNTYSKTVLYYGSKWNYEHNVYIFYPIWIKFNMEHIHELLLIMSFVAVSAVKAMLRCVN